MKQILVLLCGVMICTIFAPHDAFAKEFTVKLFESMTLDTGDDKSDKKDASKKDAKKEPKKIETKKKTAKTDAKKKDAKKTETKKKATKKETTKKELTKAKGKKTWKKIVHPPKYRFVPE